MTSSTFLKLTGGLYLIVLFVFVPLVFLLGIPLKDRKQEARGVITVSSKDGITLYKKFTDGKWIYYTQNGLASSREPKPKNQ